MPLEESCMSGSLWCGLGLKEGFVPGSCRVGGGWVFHVGLPWSSVQVAWGI